MISVLWRLSLVGFLLLICGGSAFGDSYADSSGLSFTYPDGWIPITRSTMGDVNQGLPQEMQDWIAKNNVDLNRVAVLLIRNGREEFLENINIVVEEQQIPLDDEAVKQLTDALAQQYAAMGATMDSFQGRVQKVGSHDALVVEYQARLPGVPFPLWQRQVMFPGGGNTYIVTCSAKSDSFDQYLPTFERILASIQIPAPVPNGLDWSEVGTNGAVGGIVGGLIAGLIVIIRRSSSNAKPVRLDDSTPGADRL